jgi:hypothetical protein
MPAALERKWMALVLGVVVLRGQRLNLKRVEEVLRTLDGGT